MDQIDKCAEPTPAPLQLLDAVERVRRIRAKLPGQLLRERIDTANALFGPLYSLDDVQQKIAETLPLRLGFRRSAVLEPVESYRERIPDDALLKYDDAAESKLFSRFWVATPAYRSERQVDPWILGEVTGTDLYAVIARWD
jgi:hypothetical protein